MRRQANRGQGAGIRLNAARGRWIVAATVLGSSLAMLDATIVNVALPTIGGTLHASVAGLQWTVNAYTLTLAGLILLGGALGDRYGRRRIFLIGVAWFAVASALCGLAPDIGVLIAARAVQGVGGALLAPGALAIIQVSFPPGDRARAVGLWSGLGGVAGAVGPFLGGWVIAAAGWRWAFLINLPVAAVVIAVTLRHVPESRDGAPALQPRGADLAGAGRPRRGFDVAGAVLGAAALAGICYALTEAGAGAGQRLEVIGSGLAGLAAAAGFVLTERRRPAGSGPEPMLPLEVFSSRQFVWVNVVTFAVYGGMSLLFFLLVVQLQVVAGYSPMAAGTALLPVTVLMLVLSARAGALAQRIGPRWPMVAGLVAAAAGMALTLRVGAHASYPLDVLPATVLFGLGLSMVVAPLTATVLATSGAGHAGTASGVNNAVARTGGLLAVAAVPAAVGLTGNAYHSAVAFGHGFDRAMLIAAVLLLAGAALTALTVRDDALAPQEAAAAPQCTFSCGVAAPPLEPGGRTAGVPGPSLAAQLTGAPAGPDGG